MLLVYSPLCLQYGAAGHPESPERVRSAVALLEKQSHRWLAPEPCPEADLLRVHSPALLKAVRSGGYHDPDTPFFPNIYELARLSAGAAVAAAEQALAGQRAFSLMRPPGHHAGRDRPMGFCYFNNIAVAVAKLLDGPRQHWRVAILDFDCHHGNGTEEIFFGDERVLFASVHQSPCYPGTGLRSRGNCLNYPLPPGTGPQQFLAALDDALERLAKFRPQVLAISAGFDAYRGDPITHMGLEVDSFYEIGRRLNRFEPAVPAFAVLEGGYSAEFARCVEAFVCGWEETAAAQP